MNDRERTNARVDRWYNEHGEYPRLVLGYKVRDRVSHRQTLMCLDCASSGTPYLAGNDEAEAAKCSGCGRHLRAAGRFGTEDQATLDERAGRTA